ncbi:MFS transporter [Larkinella harenae]
MQSARPFVQYPLILEENRTLRYGVFFYLYVMQGIPAGFSLTALANYLTAEGVNPAIIGSFAALVGLPWAFQFVWGAVIDRFQGSSMGRRKPWVLGAQALAFTASLGLLVVQNPVAQVQTLGWLFFGHSIFASIQDASVDAMAISIIKEDERARINAFMRAGFLVGTGLGAAVFSQLLRQYGFFCAALTQSISLLVFMLLTVFVRERPEDSLWPAWGRTSNRLDGYRQVRTSPDFRWLFTELLKGLIAPRSLLLFGASVMAYVSVSLFIRAYNYHLIQKLGWADTSVSWLTGTYGMLVATMASLLGGYLADWFGTRRFLLIVLTLIAGYLMGFSLINGFWQRPQIAQTGLISFYLMDPFLSAAAIPLLMAVCRPGVEGSQFTTYMALINLSDIAGSYAAGQVVASVDAPVVGLVAGGLVCLAFLILALMPHFVPKF